MAIAGFVLGLVGAILLSVGFSIAALRQIPKRNQRGQAFAIAGLVLSVMWVLAGGCQARVSSSLDRSKLTNTMSLRVLSPESTSWADGQRYISCLVVDSTADLTSSLLAAGG